MAKKKWSDLTPPQKAAVSIGGVLESVITVAALRDLRTRPASGVRGPKVAWLVSFVVQPFGPLAYFAVGRR
jgi:hypothetical protein